jgi:putative aldouronate transport system substrate-binding protein
MALDEEMIRKYAPKTFADVPAEAWNQTKLNGKVFMIPYTKKEYSSNVAVIRGDLREKYGLPEIKSMDDVEKYLGTVKEKESGIIPWADMNFNQAYRLASLFVYTPYYYSGIAGSQECYYNRTENTGKVYTYLDEQFYNVMLEGFKKTNDWFKKGFWSKSALTTKGGTCDQLKAGKGAFAVDNYTNVQAILDEINKNHPDWKPEAYNLNFSKYTFVSSYISNGMSIHATSKNPERALMMIELFRNDQSYFDLTTYGIKGKHYDLNADGKLLAGPDQKNFAADGACPWGWRTSLYRKNASASQSLIDIEAQFDKTAFIPPISGFSANTESIKTELAAVTNINSQYYQTLSLGVDNNVEARLKEYVEKLKAAGFEKVVSTIQTQMDEFVKTLVK